MNVDFARLNHILIPSTKEGRDRYRNSRLGRTLRPLGELFAALTPEGRLMAMLAMLAGLFGIDARRAETHLLFALLFFVLVASFLVSIRFKLPRSRLEVTAPRRASVGEEVTFVARFLNPRPSLARALRVNGPFLPYDGAWVTEDSLVPEVAPQAAAQVQLRARFSRRGEHHLDPFTIGALVPFGLVTGPVIRSEGVRFLIVPRVASVARLAMPMGRRYQPGGVALASLAGDSTEFLGVRPYRPGDPARDLHARTWARAAQPVVRERQQEYFSRIGLVVDTDVEAASPRALEGALSLAAGVVAHLTSGEALIDLFVTGEHPHDMTLGRSLGHLELALDLLACVQAGPALDPPSLMARLAEHLPRLSSLVLLVLTWTPERRLLAERIRAAGVGCRVLQVGGEPQDEVTTIPLAAIESGEALYL